MQFFNPTTCLICNLTHPNSKIMTLYYQMVKFQLLMVTGVIKIIKLEATYICWKKWLFWPTEVGPPPATGNCMICDMRKGFIPVLPDPKMGLRALRRAGAQFGVMVALQLEQSRSNTPNRIN